MQTEEENIKDLIRQEGGIAPLIDLLTNGTDLAKQNATHILCDISSKK